MKTKNLILSVFGALALTVSTNSSFAQESDSKYDVLIMVDVTNTMCSYTSDGSIKFTFSGGLAPYKVNGQLVQGNQFVLNNLASGDYVFSLQDSDLYNTTATITVNSPLPIQVSGLVNNVTSFGGQNGAINLTTTAENPSFFWTTADGSNIDPYSEDQAGLTAGVYNVQIIDENGCVAYKKYKVTQPAKPLVNTSNFSTSFTQPSQAPVIYPNPSEGTINILSDLKEGNVTVTNEIGLVVANESISNIGSINLKPGSYNVTILLDNGSISSQQLVVR